MIDLVLGVAIGIGFSAFVAFAIGFIGAWIREKE
jgi:hypothetical protein